MPPVVVPHPEPGLVAIEWPVDDIDQWALTAEGYAALLTAATREARRLGLVVGRSAPMTRRLHDPERIRFVWGPVAGDG